MLPRIVQVANLIFLFIAAWCTMGALGYRDRRVRLGGALLGVAAGLLTEPVFRTLYLGQINLLLMAAIIWDLRQPDTRRFKGIATGLAAGIKLTPLVFIPYLLLTRKWRAAAVTTGSFVFTIVLGFLILPRDSKDWWFNGLFIQDGRTGFVGWTGNQSLRAIATRLAGSIDAGTVPWVILALIATVVGLLVAAQLDRAGHAMLGLLTAALVGLLDSPISWDHHWVWVVPGMMAAGHYAARAWQARRRAAAYWCSGLIVALLLIFAPWPGNLWGVHNTGPGNFTQGLIWDGPYTPVTKYIAVRRPALVPGIPLELPAGPGGQRLHPGRHRPAGPADGGGPAVPPPGGPRPPPRTTLLRRLRQTRSPGPPDRPGRRQHLADRLLRHQRAERVGVHRHPPRLLLARQVHVEHRDPQRLLLHRQGLVREGLDLHRPVAQVGVLVDDDARENVIAHDELTAEVAKPNSLLTHDPDPFRKIISERIPLGSTMP